MPPSLSQQAPTETPAAPRGPIYFEDISDATGITTVSASGMTPEKHFPTANGVGVGMLDYDLDGWIDLYFTNYRRHDTVDPGPPNAMYRGIDGTRFEQTTELIGAVVRGHSQGIAAGDLDNDGYPDLFITQYGPDVILKNNGDGTFQDISAASGANDPRWGSSIAMLDFNEDGALDIYVTNYGKWDLEWHAKHLCGTEERMELRTYCSPNLMTPELHGLFKSSGDGTFIDVAKEMGIARADGRGQGVVTTDLDLDGHIDIYVANDLTKNFLFLNRIKKFDDMTEQSGAAVNIDGLTQAGMGVDTGDIDGDGLPEIHVTNFFFEYDNLYVNQGSGQFTDLSFQAGVAAGSKQAVKWGTTLSDFDHDGWLDIFVANGHVDDNLNEPGKEQPHAQLAMLWRCKGGLKFEKILEGAGPYFHTPHVSRGTAIGDIDNDGDIDLVVSHKDERPSVLRNVSCESPDSSNHWVGFELIGTRSNRDAVGARIDVEAGGRKIVRQIQGGRSYLSAHDLRLTIGIGSAQKVDKATIHWPSHQTMTLEGVAIDQYHRFIEPVPAIQGK